ncbi:hypothetical protein [Actinoplanes auranticolor]|nr:hypothetical protein [Actinoplanes auranticolor]
MASRKGRVRTVLSVFPGRPRRGPAIILVALVALVGAWYGGAAGHRVGLESAPELPRGAAAAQITGTVLPGLKVWGGGDPDPVVSQPDGEGIEYGYATYWVRHNDATRDVSGYSAAARDRLVAAGWDVHDFTLTGPEDYIDGGQGTGVTFWAARSGLVLGYDNSLLTGFPAYDSDGGVQLTLRRGSSFEATAAGWAGAVLGALLAWFLGAWVGRTLAGVAGGTAITGVLTVGMLVMSLPAMLMSPPPDPPGAAPWWGGLAYLGLFTTVLAALAALLLLFLAGAVAVSRSATWRRARGLAAAAVRRRPRAVFAGLAMVVAALVAAIALPSSPTALPAVRAACRPAPGVPAEAPAAQTRDSLLAHVYVDPASTPDERNLITAAIRRSWAGGTQGMVWEPGATEFRDTYCDGGPVHSEAVAGLPYFFPVELGVASDFPALVQEVQGLPGVVAVQHKPA